MFLLLDFQVKYVVFGLLTEFKWGKLRKMSKIFCCSSWGREFEIISLADFPSYKNQEMWRDKYWRKTKNMG